MFIRESKKEELDEILDLVLRSFMIYVAPTYSKEGIEEFKKFISNENAISTLKFYSALFISSRLCCLFSSRDLTIFLCSLPESL